MGTLDVDERAGSTTATRNDNLDVLRAVAALLVLVGHAYALGGTGLPVVPSHWHQAILLQGTSGVWLFFVLSGYLIGRPFVVALATGSPLPATRAYAIKRVLRIYPLYWCALAIVTVVVGVGATSAWQYAVHVGLLQDLVPGRAEAIVPVAWTLTLEMLFYAATPVLAHVVRRRHAGPIDPARLGRWILASWAASGAVLVLGSLVTGTNGVWVRQSLPAMWGMFCPGLLLAVATCSPETGRRGRWLVRLPDRRVAAWSAALVSLGIAAALTSANDPHWSERMSALVHCAARPFYAAGFGLVVARALRTGAWHEAVGDWLRQVGLVSYGIYLLHAVIVYSLLSSSGRRFIPLAHGGAVAGVVHVLFVTALTIPAALLSWHLLERPLIGWSHRVARREPAAAPVALGDAVVV